MALVIEDGTIVAGANSYVTVAEIRAYAAARGLSVPVADEDVEIVAIKAMDYLTSLESQFQGYRYDEDQELTFPREEIYVYYNYVGGEIPPQLKNAQCQLAVDAQTNDLLAAGSGREITEEKVGALSVKYNPTGNTSPQYKPTAALAILKPLFKTNVGGVNALCYR